MSLSRKVLVYLAAAALCVAEPLPASVAGGARQAEQAMPIPGSSEAGAASGEDAGAQRPNVLSAITDDELAEARRLKAPPELKATPGRKTLRLQGNSRSLFEQAARAFGLETVFDADYQPGRALTVRLDDADYRETLRALEAATGSFVFPLGERLLMVVKDTPQKRAENEPTMSVTVKLTDAVSVQEVQELARAVQQTMDILRLAVDANRRLVLIKDRISKVRPAQAVFEELARARPQVMVEMRFLEVDRLNSLAYGLLMPNQFPLTYFGSGIPLSSKAVNLARFFAGHTTIGLGIANAQLFATMNKSHSKTLIESQVRALDGTPATFHVGQKYPIISAALLGPTQQTAGFAPAFNFEDLGLKLKVTPHVHGMEEVSLDVEAEFEVLAGGSFNGIPVISNRKLESKVRVRNGEWGVVGGIMTTTEARSITGVPGLSNLPGIGTALRKNNRDDQGTEVMVLMRPVLLNPPPDRFMGRALWVGSEMKLDIPL